MQRYAFKFGYIGNKYGGFQHQRNFTKTPIEHLLTESFKATRLLLPHESLRDTERQFQVCGRTDKGVSAAGNVFAINLKLTQNEEKTLQKRVNSKLPVSVFILAVKKVQKDFSPRFDCVSREYRFYFFDQGYDFGEMRKACEILVGKHDFRHLCKMRDDYWRNGSERIIFKCELKRDHFY